MIAHLGVAGGPIDLMQRYIRTGAFDVVLTHNRFTLDRPVRRAAARRGGRSSASPCSTPRRSAAASSPARARAQGHYAYREATPELLAGSRPCTPPAAAHDVPLAAAALQFSLREPRIVSTVAGASARARRRACSSSTAWPIPTELLGGAAGPEPRRRRSAAHEAFRTASRGAPRPRATRSRAPSTRTGARSRSGTRSRTRPGKVAQRRHGRRRRRPLPPLRGGRRADGRPRRRLVPLLARLAAAAARRPRRAQRRRASTSTTGWSRRCWPRTSRPGSRSTTGTSRRCSQDAGGWPERDTAERFAEYAGAVYERLHDRVQHWTTLNEPWVLGDPRLRDAAATRPGVQDPEAALKRGAPPDARPRARDRRHARAGRRRRSVFGDHAQRQPDRPGERRSRPTSTPPAAPTASTNRIFFDPLLRGDYPADVLEAVRGVTDGATSRTATERRSTCRLDFLGINYYFRTVVRAGAGATSRRSGPATRDIEPVDARPAEDRDGLGDRSRRPLRLPHPRAPATTPACRST